MTRRTLANRLHGLLTLTVWCALLGAGAPAARAAAPVDPVLTYSGYLRAVDDAPVTEPTTVAFRIYDAASDGALLWQEQLVVTPGSEGWFSAVLGVSQPLTAELFSSGPLWLALQVSGDGAEMSPRFRMTPAPMAVSVDWSGVANRPASFPTEWADVANKPSSFPVAWADVTDKPSAFPVDTAAVQARVTGACVAGQFLRAIGPDGSVTCGTDLDTNSGGTVTSVTGSGPISVTTGTTTPAVAIAQASATTAGYLSAGDWNAFNAKLAPNAAAGGDLSGTLPSPTVARLQGRAVLAAAPASGQVLRYDGTSWVPGAETPRSLTCVTGSSPWVPVAPGSTESSIVGCPPGYMATGGSAEPSTLGTGISFFGVPYGATYWMGTLRNETGAPVSLRAWAQCCRVQ